jgi:ABC-type lipoprotein release transport system permease subunit
MGILLLIAFRNLFVSRAKTFIVGGIVLFSALLTVVGTSIVGTIDSGMRRSIQGSLSGHLQVYDAHSRDDLALYGGMMGESDLDPIKDFSKLKAALQSVPNVESVVPMGIDQAMLGAGNLFDQALERLRGDVRRCTNGGAAAAVPRQSPCAAFPGIEKEYQAHKAHMQRMVGLLAKDLSQAMSIVDTGTKNAAEMTRNREAIIRSVDPTFWAGFDADPFGALEFLENRIAPLSMDGGFLYIRYVGTDVAAYQKAFPGMEIVEGTTIPQGRRGILLAKLYAEDWLKLRTARRLDKIKYARDVLEKRINAKGRFSKGDEELQRWVKENQTSTRDILLQLDPIRAAEATRRLQRALGSSEADLQKLVVQLLTTDDDNFDQRYLIFYDELAPLLQLYTVKVGDTITIQAPSRSGYMNSVSLKVYGFIQFKGLEKSGTAGMTCVMDIMSFRDLYGFMTNDKQAEIRALKQSAKVKAISRESAEADLFGEDAVIAGTAQSGAIDEGKLLQAARGNATSSRDALFTRVYSQQEIDGGVAKNAAIILRDPRQAAQTAVEIQAAAKRAGLDIKTADWQKAAGMLGMFVTLARVILFIAVFIIFAVALVIINNAMVMATLQRVKEIGTMRAVGAQRRFILVMLLVETVTVGLTFGAAGTALGAGLVRLIASRGGIPAPNEQLYFFFSGPSLIPHLDGAGLAISLSIVFVVSMLSALYPALLATRITPLAAMQSDE